MATSNCYLLLIDGYNANFASVVNFSFQLLIVSNSFYYVDVPRSYTFALFSLCPPILSKNYQINYNQGKRNSNFVLSLSRVETVILSNAPARNLEKTILIKKLQSGEGK